MKKLINSIKNKANSAIISTKTAIESTAGEGYVDTGVKIIVGVVIGGVILAGIIPLSLSLIYLLYASRLSILFVAISVPAAYTLSALIECAGAKRITGSRPFSPWLLLGISLSLSLFARISFLLKDLFYLRLVLLGSALLFILYMLYRLLPLILEKRTSATADNQSEN